jgi:hypothetical protein
MTSITERLDAEAEKGGPHAAELRATVAKLDSYSRAPGTRKQADRIGAVLTPAVVRALGDAFLAMREEEIAGPASSVFGPDFRQGDYALAGLLLASATPDLADAALPSLQRVRDLVERMLPKQAEHVQYLVGLYPESPLASELGDAARQRLGQEPATLAATWASSIGLDLPATYWSLYLVIPAGLEVGHIDASLVLDLDNTPGSETRWSIRIGAINSDELGGNRRSSYTGGYARVGRRTTLEGRIEPASSPEELPRVLRDLEAAHPEVTWDRAGLKVSGSPGRLVSPTKKKRLIGWLSED